MFGLEKYNYERFSKNQLMKQVLAGPFHGPAPGEIAPDFETRTLDDDKIALRYFRDRKNVVLTFGSATCPFTAASIHGINELYEEYHGREVEFLFVYVREAHPGEKLRAHRSFEEKWRAAEIFRRAEALAMPIVVDDVKGTIHRKYGSLPNPTYLIDKGGRVAFRCLWTRAGIIEDALEELLERQHESDIEHAVVHGGEDRNMAPRRVLVHAHRALERGGMLAIRNFREEMGMRGRIAVIGSRVAKPMLENPGKTLAGIGIAAAVITGGILAGNILRHRGTITRTPYEIESLRKQRRGYTGGDYEAVGI